MSKEKRNIATKLETESKYLTNILDKEDVKEFKKLIPELQDTWHKKQMFRTETEMRFSVYLIINIQPKLLNIGNQLENKILTLKI
jgi:hypothetical protein